MCLDTGDEAVNLPSRFPWHWKITYCFGIMTYKCAYILPGGVTEIMFVGQSNGKHWH